MDTLEDFCRLNHLDPQTQEAMRLHLDLHEGRHDNLPATDYALAYAAVINQWLDRA